MWKTSLAIAAAALIFGAQATFAQDGPESRQRVEGQSQQQPSPTPFTSATIQQDRVLSREPRHGRGEAMMRGVSPFVQEMTGSARMRGLALQTLFALMDADGNGVVSLEEAQAFMAIATQRVFNGVDADGSGEVTLEELRAFIQGR